MAQGGSTLLTNTIKLGSNAIALGAGNTDTGTQRVVIATNQAAIPASQSGTWTVGLSAGSNAIGSITNTSFAATQSGTWTVQPGNTANTTPWLVTATGAAANGSAVSGNPVLSAGYDGTTTRTIKTATDGTLLINGVQDARQTGTITSAASTVGPFSVTNRNVVTISISGTYAGVTFVIEATDDGTNWYGLQCINNATGQAASTWTPGTNALASYDTAVGGYTQVRVRSTAWTSGTANVGISNQVFAYDPIVAALSQGLAASGSAVVGNPVLLGGSDGTNIRTLATSTGGVLYTRLYDGTNFATLKAASTAAIATDPALVVAISPNNTVAVTNATAANLQVSATQVVGSAATRWYAQLSDGTNSPAIKAASTASIATDPSLVVALSPNSPIPTGSNTIGAVNIAASQTLATVTTVGTVTTVSTVTNLAQLGGTAVAMNTGVRAAGVQRVTVATDDIVQVKTVPDATATYAPTNATTTAYAASLIAKASAGKLIMITGYNSKATAQFIQVHNSATLPADTSVPVLIFTVPPTSNFSLDLGTYGRYFSAGITICNSTTGPTKTIGSADCWFDVQYV